MVNFSRFAFLGGDHFSYVGNITSFGLNGFLIIQFFPLLLLENFVIVPFK